MVIVLLNTLRKLQPVGRSGPTRLTINKQDRCPDCVISYNLDGCEYPTPIACTHLVEPYETRGPRHLIAKLSVLAFYEIKRNGSFLD